MAATKTATKVDPIARRDELVELVAQIDAHEDEVGTAHVQAKAALNLAETTLAELRLREVKGEVASAEVQDARIARDEAAAALPDLEREVEPYRRASDKARREARLQLAGLVRRHFEVFAAEAEEASAAAVAAVQQLVPALREAAEAWATAQGAWNRLGRQLNPVEAPPLPENLAFGSVPAFPLPASLDAIQPRPRERRHAESVELIATQVAILRDKRKDCEVRAVVGSFLWRDAVGAPDRFEFVRYEDA